MVDSHLELKRFLIISQDTLILISYSLNQQNFNMTSNYITKVAIIGVRKGR